MKYVLLTIGLFAIFFMCTSPPLEQTKPIKPWLVETKTEIIHEEIDQEPEEINPKDQKIEEVVSIWRMFFDDQGASPDDDRRKYFYIYAKDLIDVLEVYQDPDNDSRAWLPKHKSTHSLLATMITLESSVTYNVVGRSNKERGLLQVHGRALAGYKPKQVQNSPRLGLLLGVRWLASLMSECPETIEKLESGNWETEDWLKPLSVYTSGPNAKKYGRCKELSTARRRVNLTKLYMTRLKAASNI